MSWADEIKEIKTICHCEKGDNEYTTNLVGWKQSVSRLKSEEMNDMFPCADPYTGSKNENLFSRG